MEKLNQEMQHSVEFKLEEIEMTNGEIHKNISKLKIKCKHNQIKSTASHDFEKNCK